MEIQLLDNEGAIKTLLQQTPQYRLVVIDIREPEEHAAEHIAGSCNVPVGALTNKDFSGNSENIALVHCRSGNRTQKVQQTIAELPFKEIYVLSGGLEQWKKSGLPIISATHGP